MYTVTETKDEEEVIAKKKERKKMATVGKKMTNLYVARRERKKTIFLLCYRNSQNVDPLEV